jgi:YidC/Oxa1 family membrane protein insertase
MLSSGPQYETNASSEWIALHSRYYFKALRPERRGLSSHFMMKRDSMTNLPVSAYEIPFLLAANASFETRFIYSFLPKDRGLLSALTDATGIQWYKIFDQFSFMYLLANAMYYPMVFINEYVKNYGITILILTLILKAVTWPLNQKSLVTMQKMQSLKPKIDEIQKTHKGDAQKVNQATMALYQKEKVNPLSGCLPMLIPMPVFFALFSLFSNMIEMDHQSFLWIKNLSLPDMAFRLPFEIPFIGHYLNLLPIIMTITQVVQSVRTPQPDSSANATQTFIFKYIFPFMFLFILWSMPSALVLFWTLQNIVSWLQAEWVRASKNRTVAVATR